VLLAQRRPEAPGSAVAATVQGSRPLLVEVQALVHASELATPRRVALGLDGPRVALLLAVLERFAAPPSPARRLPQRRRRPALEEPAVDLAIAAALLSALAEKPLPPQAAFFGEVGLLGEVRPSGAPRCGCVRRSARLPPRSSRARSGRAPRARGRKERHRG
jgi:DNA repair protein RadA/Sms